MAVVNCCDTKTFSAFSISFRPLMKVIKCGQNDIKKEKVPCGVYIPNML